MTLTAYEVRSSWILYYLRLPYFGFLRSHWQEVIAMHTLDISWRYHHYFTPLTIQEPKSGRQSVVVAFDGFLASGQPQVVSKLADVAALLSSWVCLLILASPKLLPGRNQPLYHTPHTQSYTLILQPKKLRYKQKKVRVCSDQMLNQTIGVSGPQAFCTYHTTESGCNLHLSLVPWWVISKGPGEFREA